jgi:hypothetical protein
MLTRVAPQAGLVCQHIPGWFSIHEAEALYLLAATSSARRMLEIGHFLGRSTSVICEAIRDIDQVVEFNSYDLGFKNSDEFTAHYKRVHGTRAWVEPPEYERLVFSQGTTTTDIARRHLERFNLDPYVNLISGDFTTLERTQYGFIFCDALHDNGEIVINLPHIIAASDDDCIWAFHDMKPSNVADIQSRTAAKFIRVIETLGIFRFLR